MENHIPVCLPEKIQSKKMFAHYDKSQFIRIDSKMATKQMFTSGKAKQNKTKPN